MHGTLLVGIAGLSQSVSHGGCWCLIAWIDGTAYWFSEFILLWFHCFRFVALVRCKCFWCAGTVVVWCWCAELLVCRVVQVVGVQSCRCAIAKCNLLMQVPFLLECDLHVCACLCAFVCDKFCVSRILSSSCFPFASGSDLDSIYS